MPGGVCDTVGLECLEKCDRLDEGLVESEEDSRKKGERRAIIGQIHVCSHCLYATGSGSCFSVVSLVCIPDALSRIPSQLGHTSR